MSEPTTNQIRPRNRPRLRTIEPTVGERHASWLELFFDLVFVLAVAQAAHILSEHIDLIGFLKFLAVFVPVWYAWIGFTFYADRFETEEVTYRVLMFAGMLTVTGFSLTLGGAFTPGGDPAFIVCYVIVRIVLVSLYLRAAYHIPLARSYCLQLVYGLGTSAVILLVSLLLDPPLRYILWAGSLALEIATPFLNRSAIRLIPIDRSHIPERFGLFTLIVLGETVIATASGAASVAWNFSSVTVACLGFAMVACIWWINFDFVEDNAIRSQSLGKRFLYLYSHLFIVASIVVVSVGAEHSIKEANDPQLKISTLLLMAGGVAAYLFVVTFVRLITGVCKFVIVRVIAIIFALLLIWLGGFLPPLATVAILFGVMVTNIIAENIFSPETSETEELPDLVPCEHAGEIKVSRPSSHNGCEECRKNHYKWVHLRLCLTCGHVGCCDTSVHKHATRHFESSGHPIICSLETGEQWAWCYVDESFVPVPNDVNQ